MKRVGEEQLMTQYSEADGYRNENLEAELHYNRLFAKKHDVGATLKYFQYQKVKTANVGDDIMKAIARRSMGVSGRITYAYDYRYFAEFNFGYTGSENFMSGHQFGFSQLYPLVGILLKRNLLKTALNGWRCLKSAILMAR